MTKIICCRNQFALKIQTIPSKNFTCILMIKKLKYYYLNYKISIYYIKKYKYFNYKIFYIELYYVKL